MDSRELFRRAKAAAETLERNKRILESMRESAYSVRAAGFEPRVRGGSEGDPMRGIAALVDREAAMRAKSDDLADAWIDAAWVAVNAVQVDFDDDAATILTHHYLFGETWRECAALINKRSRNTPQIKAWAALDWLDSVLSIEEDGTGYPVIRLAR